MSDVNLLSIKLLICDVDGVFTNGKYFVSSRGSVLKQFNTRDFYALEQIQKKGTDVLILTSNNDECIISQYNRLPKRAKEKLAIVINIENKLEYVNQVLKDMKLSYVDVAYIGDGLNDLEVMEKVIYRGCPADAHEKIKAISDYVSEYKGGDGCVADFVNTILEMANGD